MPRYKQITYDDGMQRDKRGFFHHSSPIIHLFILLGFFLAAFSIRAPGLLPEAFCGGLGAPFLLVDGSSGSGKVQAADQDAPEKGYEGVEKQLRELKEELERLQNEASQRFRTEVLPLLQKEIEKLNRWLREFHLDKKRQPETRET